MAGASGEENARLYQRGVEEARGGLLDPRRVLELLDVFGEEGARSHLVGFVEGEEDALEEIEEGESE